MAACAPPPRRSLLPALSFMRMAVHIHMRESPEQPRQNERRDTSIDRTANPPHTRDTAPMPSPLSALHRQVWTAMLAALIAVGALLQLPIGPVPVTLQTFSIVLAGLILGPVHGAIAMLLYLVAGCIGLPVFSGGRAGLAHLLGPTGGYLIGYVGTAMLAGMGTITRKISPSPDMQAHTEQTIPPAAITPGTPRQDRRLLLQTLGWSLLGLIPVFAVGMLRLTFVLDVSYAKAFAVGVVPFIVGDVIKVVAAVLAYRYLRGRRLLPV